jgi:signal transduction histidine kinase
MDWTLFVKIEYLSYYPAVGLFALFLNALFPKEVHKIALKIMVAVSMAFSIVVLLTPVRIFSHTAISYQIFTILCFFYGFYILIQAIHRKREGAAVLLIGFLILFISVVNDVLDINEIIMTGHFVQFGLILFIFSQAFFIAFRYSRAFMTVEQQREDLVETNRRYEEELTERQRAEKEKRALQEKLARSEKLEAVGMLAGGVAHDLNNILSGIVTYPDLLLYDLSEESHLRKPLETIRDSGVKAAAVVQDLLTLARRGVINFEVINLNDIIKTYLLSPEHQKFLLEYTNLEVETALDSNLLNIMGSPFHLKKVIINLVSNAAEAMPGGGVINISTTNRYVDRLQKGYEDIREGNYVVFRIMDRGIGISPEDLEKIFEPFYTKKVMGRSGTGLGMAVVWGTVHDHQGCIDIKSTPEKGITLELYFKVSTEEIAMEKSDIPIETYKGNGESILIVDDVVEQRLIGSKILERLGYKVMTAAGGEEAVEYLKEHPVDLVILDMIMDPGIDGLETYKRMVQIRQGIKVIISSGFSETNRVREAQKLGAGRYIKKPYTTETIGLAVCEELGK